MNSQYTYKFESLESPIPLIKCRTAAGTQFFAMVDTGSEITIIDKSLEQEADALNEDISDITLCSLSGEQSANPSAYRLQSFVSDTEDIERSFNIKGILSNLSSISEFMQNSYGWADKILVVIGSDTLTSRNALIDCEKEQLTI